MVLRDDGTGAMQNDDGSVSYFFLSQAPDGWQDVVVDSYNRRLVKSYPLNARGAVAIALERRGTNKIFVLFGVPLYRLIVLMSMTAV